MCLKKYYFYILGFFYCTLSLCENPEIEKLKNLYNKEQYDQILLITDKNPHLTADAAYWRGIAANRLQSFDKAHQAFLLCQTLTPTLPDIFYEDGQALFAIKEFRAARAQFENAYYYHYKPQVSLYYIGYISTLLEEPSIAKRAYTQITQMEQDTDHVLQPAFLGLAQLEWASAEKIKNPFQQRFFVKNVVIPYLQKSIACQPNNNLAQEATALLIKAQILTGERIDVPRFLNGLPFDPTTLSTTTSAAIGYDSNVGYYPTNNFPVTISDEASSFLQANLFSIKNFIFNKKLVITPEGSLGITHYDNPSPKTASFNSIFFNTAIHGRLEETFLSKPMATQLNTNLSFVKNTLLSNGVFLFYEKTIGIGCTQRFNFLPFGTSSLTVSFQSITFYIPDISSYNKSISFFQMLVLSPTLIFNLGLNYSINHARNSFYSHNDTKFSSSVILSPFSNWKLSGNLDMTRINTLDNAPTLGIEHNLSLGAGLSTTITPTFQCSGSFNTIQNKAKDPGYTYKKTLMSLNLSLFF